MHQLDKFSLCQEPAGLAIQSFFVLLSFLIFGQHSRKGKIDAPTKVPSGSLTGLKSLMEVQPDLDLGAADMVVVSNHCHQRSWVWA